MRVWLLLWKWRIKRTAERILIWIAWHLPRKLVMWSTIRLATTNYAGHPGDLTVMDALKRWGC